MSSCERRIIRGTKPTVLMVMCLAPMPSSVLMRLTASITFL